MFAGGALPSGHGECMSNSRAMDNMLELLERKGEEREGSLEE